MVNHAIFMSALLQVPLHELKSELRRMGRNFQLAESRLERTTDLLEGITTLLQKVVEIGQDQSTTVGVDKSHKYQSNRVGVAEPALSHAFEVCKVYSM